MSNIEDLKSALMCTIGAVDDLIGAFDFDATPIEKHKALDDAARRVLIALALLAGDAE